MLSNGAHLGDMFLVLLTCTVAAAVASWVTGWEFRVVFPVLTFLGGVVAIAFKRRQGSR